MSEKEVVEAPETVETVEAPETVEAEAVPGSLTIRDLANLRHIIDVASQRGAFKPAEFASVGEAYTKLDNFISAINPKNAEQAAEPAAEASE